MIIVAKPFMLYKHHMKTLSTENLKTIIICVSGDSFLVCGDLSKVVYVYPMIVSFDTIMNV